MNRIEFTKNITMLLLEMLIEGENPIADYLKRSDEEQHRLFNKGLSKADGRLKKSRHQYGKALDIYFLDPEDPSKLAPPKKGWKYWHDKWCQRGGKKIIKWDKGHFE